MAIPKLGVNIDHVATIREARKANEPDPITAAALAALGGAEVITCHLREDRRHINDRDLRLLRETVVSKFNVEMAAVSEIVDIVIRIRPEQVTLVPEKRSEVTTEGGLDIVAMRRNLTKTIGRLKRHDIVVSLFIEADVHQIRVAHDIGAEIIELHTGPYANSRNGKAAKKQILTLRTGADEARRLGLRVNAGHGLTYTNIRGILETLEVEELHIGHSLVSRAVLVGMVQAVQEMCELIARHAIGRSSK